MQSAQIKHEDVCFAALGKGAASWSVNGCRHCQWLCGYNCVIRATDMSVNAALILVFAELFGLKIVQSPPHMLWCWKRWWGNCYQSRPVCTREPVRHLVLHKEVFSTAVAGPSPCAAEH